VLVLARWRREQWTLRDSSLVRASSLGHGPFEAGHATVRP